jgi:isopenicillin N synthase-like dioxygenase
MDTRTEQPTEHVHDGAIQIPLIDLPDLDASDDLTRDAANRVAGALQTSGFLLVTSSHLPLELQQKAIHCTTDVLNAQDNPSVIIHPTDPKKYIMIESLEEVGKCAKDEMSSRRSTLADYWTALEYVKRQVLKCMAIGLELPPEYFINLHKQDNSALRLLHYPGLTTTPRSPDTATTQTPTIRCKPHSDYGSITLLLTDGVPGLQALINDNWTWVPHVEGALVVNIGSLLSQWTNGSFLATLHRVVGTDDDDSKPRTSLAFFADPDRDISANLKTQHNETPTEEMSVAEYIRWRSGGTGDDRSGLDFTDGERNRAEKAMTT